MARQQRKKTRAHGVAARPKAASGSAQEAPDALGAAAVAATFGTEPTDPEPPQQDEEDEEHAQSLSRGQRKRLKRRAAFLRKMGLVAKAQQDQQAQAQQRESGAFAGLEALQSSLLLQEDAPQQGRAPKRKALSGRQRQKLAVRELGQLKAVQTHAGFQSDPFAAIQAHLQNTVVQANHELLKKTEAAASKRAAHKMDVEA
ncbi:unnamed protein product [Phytophthora fragariaefolia]|uniref:Unnamed protein product n=1 Tax=Phytophthora fragariaefolia TaxID=1490495 RepID=A0A9W6XRC1_9STRA|nr:unnamed protein product [Phytophthora fragariaefolia]